jgi:hypothetical protein
MGEGHSKPSSGNIRSSYNVDGQQSLRASDIKDRTERIGSILQRSSSNQSTAANPVSELVMEQLKLEQEEFDRERSRQLLDVLLSASTLPTQQRRQVSAHSTNK